MKALGRLLALMFGQLTRSVGGMGIPSSRYRSASAGSSSISSSSAAVRVRPTSKEQRQADPQTRPARTPIVLVSFSCFVELSHLHLQTSHCLLACLTAAGHERRLTARTMRGAVREGS